MGEAHGRVGSFLYKIDVFKTWPKFDTSLSQCSIFG